MFDLDLLTARRKQGWVCLVPKPEVGGISCHERSDVCACETDALIAELRAARKVVEAAKAWREGDNSDVDMALARALEEYDAETVHDAKK